MRPEIVIVGGGISGLHTAYQLQKQGVDFILIEARDRLGGRILSNNYMYKTSDQGAHYDPAKPAYDLGPSWFWPGQIHMENLINELGLESSVFEQNSSGNAIYEDQQGNIETGLFGISMQGAYRLKGGMRQIIAGIKERIDPVRIVTNTEVKSIKFKKKQLVTTFFNNSLKDGHRESQKNLYDICSNKVVFAMPPRLAILSIEFLPSLPKTRIHELNSYPTWMAGHAKIIVTYATPFWLEQGFSGDAISHLGPLQEIHDASSSDDDAENQGDHKGFALFGFVGVPGNYRKGHEEDISKAAIEQLIRLFGKQAANPIDIVLQDWAQEEFTATEVDQTMSGGHATSSMQDYTEPGFDGRLIWSGTETADYQQGYNGLLEGALAASVRTLKLL